jgi:hypothetical protein
MGNNNNIIQVGLFEGSAIYIAGTRFYCSETSNGQLTTTANDYFAAHAVTSSQLLVNIIGDANWGEAKTIYDVEHDSTTGLHSEGSGRTFVGTGVDPGIIQSSSLASSTGMTYFRLDTGQVFHCTNGAINTWTEVSSFSGPLEIASSLEVGGDLILPTGSIVDGISNTLNVFSHGDRHVIDDGTGDSVFGIIRQVQVDADDGSSPIVLSGAYSTLGSINITFTGRGGTSTILVFAMSNFETLTRPCSFSTEFQIDGVPFAVPQGVVADHLISASQGEFFTMNQQGILESVSAGPHTITFEALISSGAAESQARHFLLIDLGPN